MKNLNHNGRIAVLAGAIFILDQLTKLLVLAFMDHSEERVIIDGFFKFVHWGNTGAAWSMFQGNNATLAIVGLVAFFALILARHHFDIHTTPGQISLGLIFGGIAGNLLDRFRVGHVIDFIYFYVYRSDGLEAGFPAFNVADTAICTGVGLLFLLSIRSEREPRSQRKPAPAEAKS